MLKIWYTATIEKIITYVTGIWVGGGGDLTKAAQIKLIYIQPMLLLRISREYKTISSDVLAIIAGIPSITFTPPLRIAKEQHFTLT